MPSFSLLQLNCTIGDGLIAAVVNVSQPLQPPSAQKYKMACLCYLNDPYEGELFAFFLDLYANFSAAGYGPGERDKIWVQKRFCAASFRCCHLR